MMKKIFYALIIFFCLSANCEGAILEKGETVAVMDFGLLKKELEENLSLQNVGQAASEYLIERLTETKYFVVKDSSLSEEKFQKQNLKNIGLLNPDDAKKIGKILGVRYLIYGNVTDVSLDEDHEVVVKVHTVRARVTARIMDVETGKILMAAKGEGKSESALVAWDDKFSVTIGTKKVSQVSVHNSIKKAAFQAADILIERLSDSKIEKLFKKNK